MCLYILLNQNSLFMSVRKMYLVIVVLPFIVMPCLFNFFAHLSSPVSHCLACPTCIIMFHLSYMYCLIVNCYLIVSLGISCQLLYIIRFLHFSLIPSNHKTEQSQDNFIQKVSNNFLHTSNFQETFQRNSISRLSGFILGQSGTII